MKINITKMHSLGNSYIIIEDIKEKLKTHYSKLSIFLSNKNFGIGSDGILVINKGSEAKYKMRIFNPDGSEAEMCGNGIRILGKYLFDKGLINKEDKIEIGNKLVKVKIYSDKVEANIGKIDEIYEKTIWIKNKKFKGYYVKIGNPHFIIFTKNEKEAKNNVKKYGSLIEKNKEFPERINVEFVSIKNKKKVKAYVWERGTGITLSCGSGAAAIASVIYNKNKKAKRIKITLPGGDILVKICKNGIAISSEVFYIFSCKINVKNVVGN